MIGADVDSYLAPAPGETGTPSSALNSYGVQVAGGDGVGNDTYPKAFVTILLFDNDYNFVDIAYEQIDGGEEDAIGTPVAHDHMMRMYTVKEPGYAFMFISNENPTEVQVYFDDVTMTHTPTNIIQYNEYYPFGLQASTSWTRENNSNNFLYNAANELNSNTGWYEMFYRGYEPALGRMLQVDPYATSFASHSPYNYSLNSPVLFNDPDGGQAKDNSMNESWRHPAWGSQRSGSGSENHWSSDIGEEGWSLDGASSSGGHLSLFEYTYRDRNTGELVEELTEYKWEWVEDKNEGPGDPNPIPQLIWNNTVVDELLTKATNEINDKVKRFNQWRKEKDAQAFEYLQKKAPEQILKKVPMLRYIQKLFPTLGTPPSDFIPDVEHELVDSPLGPKKKKA